MIFRCAQGHPIGIGGPGHHPDRAGPPRSGTMRQDRVKGEKPLRFCSPAHGVETERPSGSSRPGGLSLCCRGSALLPPAVFPRYQHNTGECPIVSELFKLAHFFLRRFRVPCPAQNPAPISAPAYWTGSCPGLRCSSRSPWTCSCVPLCRSVPISCSRCVAAPPRCAPCCSPAAGQ